MRLVASLVLGCLLVAAAAAAPVRDPHSAARLDLVRVRHVFLDLDIDFDQRQLKGFAELSLDWQRGNARRVDLDTRALAIERVLAADSEGHWRRVPHRLGAIDPVLGQPLHIELSAQAPKLRIYYHTSAQASGLQWLRPEQTLDKRLPFMFSQAQAIHARSFVPLQDTPAQRFTYSARITAPEGIRVLMSADNEAGVSGHGAYRFDMPQPIPSYLLAIAAGDLAYRELGPRSRVYAEPGRLAAAAQEFSDTEAMITATEKLYGAYRWGRYDLLILPPSFPFGGMENPRLSFITPTVIAGDKSLVSLIAHELAHSWSGNLVTNSSWRDAWLNEGFTSYVENRIVESVYGEAAAEMQQVVNQHELLEEMATLPEAERALVQGPLVTDPDQVFSQVPYTKGEWLLRTLEICFGRERFDPVLRAWFDEHAFESVDSDEFLRFFGSRLFDKEGSPMQKRVVEAWLHAPGIPEDARRAHSARLAEIDRARGDFVAGRQSAAALAAGSWSTTEWLHFLNGLPATSSAAQLAELDQAYRLTGTGNAEIALRFYLAAIRADYPAIRPALKAHLIAIGRRKLIVPLWTELARTPANKRWALAVYAEARPGYHPIARATIDPLLGFAP